MSEYIDTALILSLAIIFVIDHFKKMKNKSANKLVSSLNRNTKIYPILWKLLIKYNAIRVIIIQFHNGNNYYSGNSIQRMSVSHEVTREGVKELNKDFTDVALPESTNYILTKVLNLNHFYIKDNLDFDKFQSEEEKNINKRLLENMSIYSTKSSLSIPLSNRDNQIIGLMNVDFNFTNSLSELDITKIKFIKVRIENLLNNN